MSLFSCATASFNCASLAGSMRESLECIVTAQPTPAGNLYVKLTDIEPVRPISSLGSPASS